MRKWSISAIPPVYTRTVLNTSSLYSYEYSTGLLGDECRAFLRVSYVRFRSRRLNVHHRIIARISRRTPRNICYESFLTPQTFSYAFLTARVRALVYASPHITARRHGGTAFTAHTRQHQISQWRELSNCRTMAGSSRPPLAPSDDRQRAPKFDPRFEQNVQARAALFHAALKADIFSNKSQTAGFTAAAEELKKLLDAREIQYNGVPRGGGVRGKLLKYVEIYKRCALSLPFHTSTCLILRFPDCPLSSTVRWSQTGRLLICHAI